MKLGYYAIRTSQDHSKSKRIPDLLLGGDPKNETIENSFSAIEFKKVGQLKLSKKSKERDYLLNEAAKGMGQLIEYCKNLMALRKTNRVDCALSDFQVIIFVQCYETETADFRMKISDRYKLSNQDGESSEGFDLLVCMWAFVIKAQAIPVKTHLGTDLPPMAIKLDKSSSTYVLTHLLCKTSKFWIICAYQLPTFKTVVIKISNGWYAQIQLAHEANILQQLLGIEGVQQLVEFGLIVGSRSYWALVTVPLGISLSVLFPYPISRERATDIVLKVSAILHQIHQRNIVHRDIKPSNIIMVDEKPIIIDFGCAIKCDHSGIYIPWSGTVEFAAIESNDYTYPDHDYESLVYTAIQLTHWLLPWSNTDKDTEQIKKEKTINIVESFPSRFVDFVRKKTKLYEKCWSRKRHNPRRELEMLNGSVEKDRKSKRVKISQE